MTDDLLQSDKELLLAAYKHFNARDLDAALETMHEDVEWPNGMDGGRVEGHSGVREYWTRQWGMIDPHVDPLSFTPEGAGKVLVSVHQVVRALDGSLLGDQIVEHHYTIEAGLIRRMDIGGETA